MKLFMTLAACAVCTAFVPSAGAAEDMLPDCSAERVGLQCVERREVLGPWQLEEVLPAVGSQNSLLLSSPSFQPVPGLFGREESATLVLSCVDNTTRFEVRFGENFVSDVNEFGVLVYKIDDQAPVALSATASEDNTALGLYIGAEAIPLIRSLFGGERLLVSATSFTGRPLNASFSIEDVEAAVESLRNLCNW
jgi:type VI secretion system protein VasI